MIISVVEKPFHEFYDTDYLMGPLKISVEM